jgi:hypothetical protein
VHQPFLPAIRCCEGNPSALKSKRVGRRLRKARPAAEMVLESPSLIWLLRDPCSRKDVRTSSAPRPPPSRPAGARMIPGGCNAAAAKGNSRLSQALTSPLQGGTLRNSSGNRMKSEGIPPVRAAFAGLMQHAAEAPQMRRAA